MIRIDKNKKIEISRGDTGVIPCIFRVPSLAPEDGTMAVFTLKRDYNDKRKDKIWEKKYYILDGRFQIEFTHEDTVNLLNDVIYYYDIQLRYPDGQQWTLIEPKIFKILGVVGDAED